MQTLPCPVNAGSEFQPIGGFIKEHSSGRALTGFHRDQPVHHIANQSNLNTTGRGEQPQGASIAFSEPTIDTAPQNRKTIPITEMPLGVIGVFARIPVKAFAQPTDRVFKGRLFLTALSDAIPPYLPPSRDASSKLCGSVFWSESRSPCLSLSYLIDPGR